MRTFRAPARAALLLALIACGEDPTEPSDPPEPPIPGLATIEVTPATDTLSAIADTVHLTAVALDSSGAEIPGVTFTWASSDTAVAVVGAGSGITTARSNGPVVVTASAGGESGQAELLVEQEVVEVVVSPAAWTAQWDGARQQFAAEARDANGYPVPGVDFVWSSSAPEVAAVDEAGVGTALSSGTAHLTALSSVGSAEATVTADFSPPLEGVVYSVWFARSDSAPALLVDDSLVVRDLWNEPKATTPWEQRNVAKFQWRGDRIGLLTDVVGGAGNFRVRDRVGEWVDLAIGTAVDFQLSGNLIAQVTSSGELRVKEGIHGPWSYLASGGVREFQMAGARYFAMVDGAGKFWAKDGVNGPWWPLADGGVKKFVITSGGRLGLLLETGEFKVKEEITGPWTLLAADDGEDFALAGARIGLLHQDGRFRVKDGVNGAWTLLESGGVTQFALAGDRIATLKSNGVFRVKDGVNGAWTVLASSGVREIRLQGDLVGFLSESNVLSVKQGIHGGWLRTGPIAGNITQFRLLVDVPVPPARITPAVYAQKQADCAADLGAVDCTSPWEFGIVPIYGRFCGRGIPTDADWDAAHVLGPIDPLDALCLHHDHADSWYPEAVAFDACVVNYGVYYSRLTQNGALLTHGGDNQADWDAGWGNMMPNLKAAVEAYFDYTNQCLLNDFTEDTASQN